MSLRLPKAQPTSPRATESAPHDGSYSPARRFLRRFVSHRAALLGLIVLLVLAGASLLAPWITPYDPYEMVLIDRLKPPSAEHWFGTDTFGRDIFTRVLYGGRISLTVGLASTALGLSLGVIIGVTAAFYGHWWDHVAMRALDTLYAFPAILLAMAIAGALGTGLFELILAIGLVMVPAFARIVRSSALSIREAEFVEAAEAIGVQRWLILCRHVLPGSLGPVVVAASLQTASAILATASLSFMGIGIQPPLPEWGSMLAEGRGYLTRAPYMMTFPGLAIMLTVMGFNLVGDALRDALDPTLRV